MTCSDYGPFRLREFVFVTDQFGNEWAGEIISIDDSEEDIVTVTDGDSIHQGTVTERWAPVLTRDKLSEAHAAGFTDEQLTHSWIVNGFRMGYGPPIS